MADALQTASGLVSNTSNMQLGLDAERWAKQLQEILINVEEIASGKTN